MHIYQHLGISNRIERQLSNAMHSMPGHHSEEMNHNISIDNFPILDATLENDSFPILESRCLSK